MVSLGILNFLLAFISEHGIEYGWDDPDPGKS
jgi:hypothetical protein